MTAPRPGSVAWREARAEVGSLPPLFGAGATFPIRHFFRQLTVGLGGAQCAVCFGWRDDWRHR